MERNDPLPSWRPGTARDALEAFLAAAEEVPVADRVAYFDNDGTLWCERPSSTPQVRPATRRSTAFTD